MRGRAYGNTEFSVSANDWEVVLPFIKPCSPSGCNTMQLSNSIEVDPKDSQKRIKAFRSPTPFYGTSVKKVDIPDFQRLEFLTSLELNGFGISFSLPGFRNLFHLRHVKLVLTVIDFEDMHMDDSNTFRLPHSDSDISISNSPREGFPVLRCLELVNSRSFFFSDPDRLQ